MTAEMRLVHFTMALSVLFVPCIVSRHHRKHKVEDPSSTTESPPRVEEVSISSQPGLGLSTWQPEAELLNPSQLTTTEASRSPAFTRSDRPSLGTTRNSTVFLPSGNHHNDALSSKGVLLDIYYESAPTIFSSSALVWLIAVVTVSSILTVVVTLCVLRWSNKNRAKHAAYRPINYDDMEFHRGGGGI